MAFRMSVVSIRDGGAAEELNAFLRSHRILSVDKHWVERGADSFWSFCVDYLDSEQTSSRNSSAGSKPKLDYREILKPEEFSVFAKLRDWRKSVAESEGVPVYTIFTNAQLAEMVQRRITTKNELAAIAGVGEARIEKHGQSLLELLSEEFGASHETDGESTRANR